MLENLLESRSKRGRSVGGVLTSVTAHTALIGAALYATAQARVPPAGIPEVVRPFFIPPAPSAARATPTPKAQKPTDARRLNFIEPRFDLSIPVVDISAAVSTSVISEPGDFTPGSITANGTNVGGDSVTGAVDTPFRADQVEQQVSVVSGSSPPQYPEVQKLGGGGSGDRAVHSR